MKLTLISGALALAVLGLAAGAQADDPNDPDMRDPKARAADKAMIRKLNLEQLRYVQRRDAQYAEGWRAWKKAQDAEKARRARTSGDD